MFDEQPPPDCAICLSRPAAWRSLSCGGCYARMRGDLATLAWAYEHLGRSMRAITPSREGTSHRRGESRPPFRLDLHDVRFSIEENITRWGAYVAQNHLPAIRGPVDQAMPTVAHWLMAETLPWVSGQEWVPDFASDLAEHRRNAYSVSPWERLRVDLPAPCPGCRMLTLSTYPGDTTAICRTRTCGRQVPLADMRETRRWLRSAA